ECGIATYTYDLKNALQNKFEESFEIKICALESNTENHTYKKGDVDYVLNTDEAESFVAIGDKINMDKNLDIVMIQHEFGLFKNNEEAFVNFLKALNKPIIMAFHTVLPHPNEGLKKNIKNIISIAKAITVMTKSSFNLLIDNYQANPKKIKIISHGTHLVKHQDKSILKEKHHVLNRKVISTFGFLGPGKNIETTLNALPEIINTHPDILFLIVGKTHPTLFNKEGDAYMVSLQKKVDDLKLKDSVRFV